MTFFHTKKQEASNDIEEIDGSPEEVWNEADKFKGRIMEDSLFDEVDIENERNMIEAMEIDVLRLRERYKHDSNKQIEIANDWFDFAKAIFSIKFTKEMIYVGTDNADVDLELHINNLSKFNIIIQEITKRVVSLLGEDSVAKTVQNEIKTRPTIVNNIVKK